MASRLRTLWSVPRLRSELSRRFATGGQPPSPRGYGEPGMTDDRGRPSPTRRPKVAPVSMILPVSSTVEMSKIEGRLCGSRPFALPRRNNNRSIWLVYVATFLCLSFAGVYGAALKFASLAPEGTSWMKQMHLLADELADSTDGRVRIKFYPGGVAGDERDVLRKMRIGQIHAAGFTGNGLGEIISAVRLLDTPFLFNNIAEYDSVLAEVSDTLSVMFREKGYELAGWASVGMVHIFSKNPISSMEELRRSRPWVWETDPLASALFSKLSISPIPLPLPQVLTSLQTGVIDVAYASPAGAVALQWFTRVRYMTDLPLTHSTGGIVISTKFLNRLARADRALTLRLFRQHLEMLEPITREEAEQSLEVLVEEGIKFVPVSPDDASPFLKTGAELRIELAGDLYPEWLMEKVHSILDRIRQ